MARINSARISEMFSCGADVYERATETLRANAIDKMIEQGVLVGLSGGADSVMLLCFLLEYRLRNGLAFPIVALHVNHGIRGAEADADEAFCKTLCDEFGIEFLCLKKDVPSLAKEMNLGLEEAAREVRYSVFQEILSGRSDISTIAVAHNMSDNAETVLLNILRGCGARGAGGIRSVRGNIVRPLIDISKNEITSLLDSFGITYVTDSSNLSDDYSRNYVRHEVMPTLIRLTSDPEKMLVRFAANLNSDEEYILSVAREFISKHKIITNQDLQNLHYSVFVRVLTLMSGYQGGLLSQSLTKDVYNLLDKDNFGYSLPNGVNFICERGICRVGEIPEAPDYKITVDIGLTTIDEVNSDFIISKEKLSVSFLNVYKKSIQADLSSAIIEGSLYVRPKVDGDTVYYGRMTHKLKKLFNDKKMPISARKTLPILCDERGVVWVPGFGVRDDDVPKDERRALYAVLASKE